KELDNALVHGLDGYLWLMIHDNILTPRNHSYLRYFDIDFYPVYAFDPEHRYKSVYSSHGDSRSSAIRISFTKTGRNLNKPNCVLTPIVNPLTKAISFENGRRS